MERYLSDLNKLFSQYQEIKLVYLFGSQAKNQEGPLSDFDFAVYLETNDLQRKKDIVLELNSKLSLLLKTNKLDLVIINNVSSSLLKFNILKDGKLIYEKIPYRLIVEPKILDNYFDFQVFQKIHNL